MTFRQSILVLTITVALVQCSQAQQDSLPVYTPPMPTIGWDSLQALIVYPEWLHGAAVEGAANVYALIDSTGKVDTVTILANHELFKLSVRKALYQTQWIPGKYHGKAEIQQVSFNVHFYANDMPWVPRLSVSPSPSKVQLNH